ncbi:SEC-C domain-containing protein [Nocardia aurantia]|uniref:SEC-C motif-containing protein n=1 Tax=Nocardia aurantia TaxID=2585199 RepID=A0A7K0DIS7_9NOCA|nr:SEC-C domain-containing protein [Nocardia aurantia]MQY25726.1 hypothetical protein [Nocardia aurantia]
MSEGSSGSERAELEALRRENARLTAELEVLAGQFRAAGPAPEELALEYEDEGEAGDPRERAQNLNEAASYWVLAGDLVRARRRYLDAIADGGEVAGGGARVWYALFLMDHGDQQAGRKLLGTVFDEGPEDFSAYELVGEMFEERGEFDAALRWFEAGLTRLRMGGDDPEHRLGRFRLSGGRGRVRRALGLPEDAADLRVDADQASVLEQVNQRFRPQGPEPVSVAVLYFPAEELSEVDRRWPRPADEYGSHDEHLASVELQLRAIDPGMSPRVAVATAAGFAGYVADHGVDPLDSSARAAYAAELARRGQALVWPPGRNEQCWCGSGRKYKKCCGKPN